MCVYVLCVCVWVCVCWMLCVYVHAHEAGARVSASYGYSHYIIHQNLKAIQVILSLIHSVNRNTKYQTLIWHALFRHWYAVHHLDSYLPPGGVFAGYFTRKWLLSLYSENNFFYYFHCGRLATSDGMISLARRRSRVHTRRPARWLFPFFQNSFFQNIILEFRQAKLCLRV